MTRWLPLPVFVLLVCGGCVLPQESVTAPQLDESFYRDHVHPIARFSCASLECHGVDGRPLRLYAEDGLRASAALRGEPLSAEEAAENVFTFALVDPEPEAVELHVVLTKPLSVDAGGLAHVGGDLDLWLSRADPSYVCLRGWLAGDFSVAAVCDEAAMALDPDP